MEAQWPRHQMTVEAQQLLQEAEQQQEQQPRAETPQGNGTIWQRPATFFLPRRSSLDPRPGSFGANISHFHCRRNASSSITDRRPPRSPPPSSQSSSPPPPQTSPI